MIKPVRGAAFAVAACALAASAAWANPLDGAAATASAPWSAHVAADPPVSELGLNDAELSTPIAADAEALQTHMAQFGGAEPASLEAQVAASTDIAPQGAEESCLASAVYFEARGESLQGQLAVAEVVMNRAASGRYPETLCGVVRQRSQFSFVHRGSIPDADRGTIEWRNAVAIARIARAGTTRLLPDNVLWYHANYVNPTWCHRLARNTRLGRHIFYS
jgi:spore germination cell wall hydrolase CwlJ-like protein